MTTPRLDETIDVATVAELHDQVVVRLRFCASDQRHDMAMLYLGHDLDLVYQ